MKPETDTDMDKDRPRLLIISPRGDDLTYLSALLGDEYEVLTANNSGEALAILNQSALQGLLLDLAMPEVSGLDFLAQLKRSEALAPIPVLALIDHEAEERGLRAVELGAADYLTRPFQPPVVQNRLKNALARRENEWHLAERQAQEQQLKKMHQSLDLDPLTGLLNREAFYRRTADLVQSEAPETYAVIYLDISCFKAVNDLFLMDTGNMVLKSAAYYFKAYAGENGLAGRMEADHFVLCLPKATLDAEFLLNGLDNTMTSLGLSHNILFYAGIYPVKDIYLPADQMCDRASLALKRIKGSYIKRYGYYDDSMREQMLREQMIVRDMELALISGHFCCHLQPIYSLKENRIMRGEALVRWNHPTRGLIPPGEFIPVFERNGFIVKLDRFIWETVCRLLKLQKERLGNVTPISVNISRLNFYSADLVDFLTGLVARYELEPWMLNLEITERAYTDNPHQLIPVVKTFRELGFRVLMDDFGSGYSSLSMLKNLPVDVLKIDMTFAQEMAERVSSIMKFILELCKALKTEVVVEGVETKEQVEFLERIGGEEIQGYYYSKPMEAEQFLTLLANTK